MKRFLMAVDDFYPDPARVRERALGMEYSQPEHLVGWRTLPFHPKGVRERAERILRARVTDWPGDPSDLNVGNGSFFYGLSAGPRAETVGVHYDRPAHYVTMVVYLTPGAPPDAGTSLWRHRATGLAARPTRADARRLGVPLDELEARLLRDSTDRRRWVEIDRVGNLYNRAVFYRSGLLHSATRHFGSRLRDGRLYQTFRFGVDWKID